MLIRVLLFSFLATNLAIAGSSSSRIVGGSDAAPKEFPFIADILLNNAHRCAGFIYNERWVVTTASCVYGYSASQLKVVAGQLTLTAIDPGEKTYSASSVTYHSSYNSASKENNIAMIQVSSPFTFGDFVNFIIHENLTSSSVAGILIGWGSSELGGASQNKLQKTLIPIITDGSCPSIDPSAWNSNVMICAGETISSGCTGDIGGPLVLGTSDYRVVGILSHISTTSCQHEAAFVRLSSYTNWMLAVGGTAGNPVTVTSTTSSTSAPLSSSESSTASTGTISPSPFLSCNFADQGQFPFIVSIGNEFGRHLCSGFMYDQHYVVTSASCVDSYGVTDSGFFVYPDLLRLNELGATYTIESITYEPTSKLLALIKVTSPFQTGSKIGYDAPNYADPSSTVIGWAATEVSDCGIPSLDLLWGSTSLSLSGCTSLPSFDQSNMICAGIPATTKVTSIFGSCGFEGGAPLIQGNPPVVIGVKIYNETTEQCASGQGISIYASIVPFYFWLNEITSSSG